jgi:hypothetical protein
VHGGRCCFVGRMRGRANIILTVGGKRRQKDVALLIALFMFCS